MYTIKKERNFMVFTDDETKKVRKFDLTIGLWTSAKDDTKYIKSQPISDFNILHNTKGSELFSSAIIRYKNRLTDEWGLKLLAFLDKACSIERLNNMRIVTRNTLDLDLDFMLENFAFVVKIYSQEGCNEEYIKSTYIRDKILEEKYKNLYDSRVNRTLCSFDNFLYLLRIYPIFERNINMFIHYINQGACFLGMQGELKSYFVLCEEIKIPIEKGNLIKNYTSAKMYEEAHKQEIINNAIKKMQTYVDFSFENENFYMEIPKTYDDFQRLGKEFNNCLGGWEISNRIKPQLASVAIMRGKTNNWKVCLDIRKVDKQIDQFYLPSNRYSTQSPYADKIQECRDVYQKYLLTL